MQQLVCLLPPILLQGERPIVRDVVVADHRIVADLMEVPSPEFLTTMLRS